MKQKNKINRREAVKQSFLFTSMIAIGGLPTYFPLKTNAQQKQDRQISSDILIVYFTRSGNTRVVANKLQQSLNADIFELIPAIPYSVDYRKNVAEAANEKEKGLLRAIKNPINNLAQYKTIYLGFPVWGGTLPSIIKSFLNEYDLSQKTLIPFITHGNYGVGDSLSIVQEHVPNAHISSAYIEQCDQERDTIENIENWLNNTNI